MSLIVAGTFRVPAEQLAAFSPHMTAMMSASRAEDGCLEYSYAQDVFDPGLIRVFEEWRDEAALQRHFETPHLAAWRASWAQFGVCERRLFAYEIAAKREV